MLLRAIIVIQNIELSKQVIKFFRQQNDYAIKAIKHVFLIHKHLLGPFSLLKLCLIYDVHISYYVHVCV